MLNENKGTKHLCFKYSTFILFHWIKQLLLLAVFILLLSWIPILTILSLFFPHKQNVTYLMLVKDASF